MIKRVFYQQKIGGFFSFNILVFFYLSDYIIFIKKKRHSSCNILKSGYGKVNARV
ncbi:hypothetical protein C8P67_102293 [Flavobacterium aquicola]|uniref:Uncharacterized protein n=1 Tax=Flavobacterium aquicola TaxID=1682742 RepID=A0A3E0EV91_9FLAO|nr:hypothetical protein C8P67_102293 [Flavobacterium aquicola]